MRLLRRLWTLGVGVALGLGLALVAVELTAGHDGAGRGGQAPAVGQWHPAPEAGSSSAIPESPVDATEAAALLALGYAEAEDPAPAYSGVTRHDDARMAPGMNLLVSGHAAEAVLLTNAGTM